MSTRNLLSVYELNPNTILAERTCAANYFGLWLVEPQWFQSAVSAIALGTWQPRPRPAAEDRPQLEARESDGREFAVDNVGIARIRLDGVLMKPWSKFGGTSTVAARRAIRQAALDPEVRGIMLEIDSPGGHHAGTAELASDVAAANAEKPVHAFIEDLGASAAYYVASQAGRVSANRAAQVGSIGTLAVIHDLSKAAEVEGIRVIVVSTGPHKGSFVPGTEVTEAQLEPLREEVDDAFGQFLEAVAVGRGRDVKSIRAEWASGRTWNAPTAKKMGMLDGVETFDAALTRLESKLPKRRAMTRATSIRIARARIGDTTS